MGTATEPHRTPGEPGGLSDSGPPARKAGGAAATAEATAAAGSADAPAAGGLPGGDDTPLQPAGEDAAGGGSPPVVGVVARIGARPDVNCFCPQIVASVSATVERAGGRTVFLDRLGGDPDRYADLAAVAADLEAAGARGVILVEHTPEDEVGGARLFPRRRVPTVWITPRPSLIPVPTVYHDNDHAGYLGALHLIETGCRILLFPYPSDLLTLPEYRDHFFWLIERIVGADRACQRNGGFFQPVPVAISVPEPAECLRVAWVEMGAAAAETVASAMEEAPRAIAPSFAQRPPRAGILAPNDRFALGLRAGLAARRAAAAGGTAAALNCPEDYALLGFDNTPEGVAAGLTSLEPPIETLGQRAADLIMDLISLTPGASGIASVGSGEATAPMTDAARAVRIRPTLHPRATTRRR